MPDREYLVYRLTNTVTGQCYVGVTCMHLRARWWKHTSCARLGADTLLYRAMREYGIEAFEMTVVRSGVTEADRWTAEREEIARAGSCGAGYNELPGVPRSLDDSGVPVCFTSERAPLSEAHRQALSAARRGRHDSAETRARKTAAQTGNKKGCKPIVYDGIEYPSIKDCARCLGVTRGVVEWGLRRGHGHYRKKVA